MAQGYDSGALDEPRLRELIEVGRSLVAELDPEVIFRQVLEVACELTGARYAALGVLDEDRHELERFITHGIDEATKRAIGNLPRGRGVLGLLIEQPRPLRLADVGDHPRSYGFPPGHPPMTNFLGVPVMIRGHAWGNLYLTEKAERRLRRGRRAVGGDPRRVDGDRGRERPPLQQRRGAARQMERAVHSLEATTEIARAVGGETDLDRILETIVKRGRALVDARSLLILLADRDELRTASFAGEREPRMPKLRIPIAGSIPGQVLEARGRAACRPRPEPDGAAGQPRPASRRCSCRSSSAARRSGVLVALDSAGPGRRLQRRGRAGARLLRRQRRDRGGHGAVGRRRADPQQHRGGRARARPLGARAARRVAAEHGRPAGPALHRPARRRPRSTDELLGQAIERVDNTIAEMRRLIADLRPTRARRARPRRALEALVERLTWATALDVELRDRPRLPRRPPPDPPAQPDRGHGLPARPGGAQQRGATPAPSGRWSR